MEKMSMNKYVEAEENEIILQDENDNIAIIPKRLRNVVLNHIKSNRQGAIKAIVKKLPTMKDYAGDGSVVKKDDTATQKIDAEKYYNEVVNNPSMLSEKPDSVVALYDYMSKNKPQDIISRGKSAAVYKLGNNKIVFDVPHAFNYQKEGITYNNEAGWKDALNKVDNVLSYPQRKITELITGKFQDPSEAMGIDNPLAAAAVNMIADPLNLAGPLLKGIGAGTKVLGRVLGKIGNAKIPDEVVGEVFHKWAKYTDGYEDFTKFTKKIKDIPAIKNFKPIRDLDPEIIGKMLNKEIPMPENIASVLLPVVNDLIMQEGNGRVDYESMAKNRIVLTPAVNRLGPLTIPSTIKKAIDKESLKKQQELKNAGYNIATNGILGPKS